MVESRPPHAAVRDVAPRSEYKKGDIIIAEREIDSRLEEVADEIAGHYGVEPFTLVPVLHGAFLVAADLGRKLADRDCRITLDSVQVGSYVGKNSSGTINLIKEMDNPSGHVLLVDDVVDTANTLSWLEEKLGPQVESVSSFGLISKPARREVVYDPKFLGFTITDDIWLEGYGMDSDGLEGFKRDVVSGESKRMR